MLSFETTEISLSAGRSRGFLVWPRLLAVAKVGAEDAGSSLQEEYVLEHMPDILTTLRNSNAALRWLLLHGKGTQRRLRAAVASAEPGHEDLLCLLLDIANLEEEVPPPDQRFTESVFYSYILSVSIQNSKSSSQSPSLPDSLR